MFSCKLDLNPIIFYTILIYYRLFNYDIRTGCSGFQNVLDEHLKKSITDQLGFSLLLFNFFSLISSFSIHCKFIWTMLRGKQHTSGKQLWCSPQVQAIIVLLYRNSIYNNVGCNKHLRYLCVFILCFHKLHICVFNFRSRL
jgi:hypothetical protein